MLLVDAGDPRNAAAGHVHNFLTRDGTPPADLYAAGRDEVRGYDATIIQGRAAALVRDGELFRAEIDGRTVTAQRILLATGSWDELPEIPGLAPRWGIDVLHCPYCHGWEVRDRHIGVLATSPMAVHQALLFRQLSPRVCLLQHSGPEPTPEQAEQLAALGIAVVTGTVAEVTADTDGLTGVRLVDGCHVELDTLVVAPVCHARAELLGPLGVQPSEVRLGPNMLGTQVDADTTGATAAAGVWVAGNVADVKAQVVTSAAAGLLAGAAINIDLVTADADRAVHAHRTAHSTAHSTAHDGHAEGDAAWDQRYAATEQVWSGHPNGTLVAEVTGLPPGRALDVGCGEGADAIWLAGQGWDVTALDVSRVALDRAVQHAELAGVHVDFVPGGLLDAPLGPGAFDLVSAQYPALLRTPDHDAERTLIAGVAPGGVLLVVHHAHVGAEHAQAHGFDPADYVMPEDVAALLGDGWQVEVDETRPRTVSGGAGAGHSHDLVLRARRRS